MPFEAKIEESKRARSRTFWLSWLSGRALAAQARGVLGSAKFVFLLCPCCIQSQNQEHIINAFLQKHISLLECSQNQMQFSVLNAWMFRGTLQMQIACCVLRCKFHVFKLQGSGDMVTQNYQCVRNHEIWFPSRTHSSNYDGDVTMLELVFINRTLCCIQWYKFHVCRGRVQEIQSHKLTCVLKNHFTGSQLHI